MCIYGVICSGREYKIVQGHSCCLTDFPQNREQGFCLIIYPRGRGNSSSFSRFVILITVWVVYIHGAWIFGNESMDGLFDVDSVGRNEEVLRLN